MSDISNEEYAQAVEVSKLKQRIAELELAAKPASELAEKAAFWDYFCNRIPSMNRDHLHRPVDVERGGGGDAKPPPA
jgi:hypothetical protein